MIIIAKDGNRYLVKTSSGDNKCYCVDLGLGYVYGYDIPEKFLRFGYYESFNMEDLDEELEDKIKALLI